MRISILIAILFNASLVYSQSAVSDTLWPGQSSSSSDFVILPDSAGGYVIGTNTYRDLCKAQQFKVDSGYIVEGAIFWFARKTVVTNDSLRFVIWKMDSTEGITSAGSQQKCPGTELAVVKASMQDVDTSSSLSQAFVVWFDAPLAVYEDYAIGFDMSALQGDSVALWSTSNGSGGGAELVWEKWRTDSNWRTLQAAGWGFPAYLDVDAMILPLVDMSSAGISDHANPGFSCQLHCNPVNTSLVIKLTFSADARNNTVRILDQQGKLLMQDHVSHWPAGSLQYTLNVSSLGNGNYFFTMNGSAGSMALPFSVFR
jgi:hypothetical protein